MRIVVLYSWEYWVVENKTEQEVSVAEIRIPRWICVVTMEDRIRTRGSIGVTPIVDEVRVKG